MEEQKKTFNDLEKEVTLTQDKVERILDRLARSGLKDYLDYLSSPSKIFASNFLAGIARGFGFMLGATVILSFFIFLIGKILVGIPVIGQFFDWLNQFLQESVNKNPNNLIQ